MRVSDCKAHSGAAGYDGAIAGNRRLFDGIDDFSSVIGIFFKIFKRRGPEIAGAEHHALSGFNSVCKQNHLHLSGTYAVLVVSVIPDFVYGDTDLFRNVAVLDLEYKANALGSDNLGITVNRLFIHRVIDGCAVHILRQRLERVGPAVAG